MAGLLCRTTTQEAKASNVMQPCLHHADDSLHEMHMHRQGKSSMAQHKIEA